MIKTKKVNLFKDLGYVKTGLPSYKGKKKYFSTGSVKSNFIEEEGIFEFKDLPSRANRLVFENDILQARMAQTNKAILITKKYDNQIFSTGFIQFRPSKNVVIPKYLYYYLFSDLFNNTKNFLCTGATQSSLNDNKLKEIYLNIPDINNQNKIVLNIEEIFQKINDVSKKIENKISSLKFLFKNSTKEIFSNINETQDKIKLEKVCDKILAGGDVPKNNFSKLKDKNFNIEIIGNALKDNGLYGYTNKATVNKPAITVAARGSGTGHVEVRKDPFFPIVRLIVLIPDTKIIELDYLKYSILNLDFKIGGSAIPQLTIPMIKKYAIPLPKINKQQKIVEKLNRINTKIGELKNVLIKKLEILEKLKQSVLREKLQ